MATTDYSQWEPAHPIIYSAASDETIATMAQKTIAETAHIYELLARLRTHDASSGTTVDDAVPYQFKVNTLTQELLVRNADNSEWIIIGKLAANLGFSAETVNAVPTTKGINSLNAGPDADKPLAANSKKDDLYISTDQKKIYRMGETDWELILSLNAANLIGYEDLITINDVSNVPAPNKVVKTDSNGSLGFDITGSASKIVGKPIDATDIADGRVPVYRDSAHGFVFESKGSGGTGTDNIDDNSVSTGTTYSSNKVVSLLGGKQDITGDLHPFSCAYDANGEYKSITVDSKTYTISRDAYNRLDTISDGTNTIRASYNSYGQFVGMEAV